MVRGNGIQNAREQDGSASEDIIYGCIYADAWIRWPVRIGNYRTFNHSDRFLPSVSYARGQISEEIVIPRIQYTDNVAL